MSMFNEAYFNARLDNQFANVSYGEYAETFKLLARNRYAQQTFLKADDYLGWLDVVTKVFYYLTRVYGRKIVRYVIILKTFIILRLSILHYFRCFQSQKHCHLRSQLYSTKLVDSALFSFY